MSQIVIDIEAEKGRLYHFEGATHFVLPRREIGEGRHALVKEADYFIEQGGLTEPWGDTWIPVVADGINHARLLAWFLGSNTPHPQAIAFNPPNWRTVGHMLSRKHTMEEASP